MITLDRWETSLQWVGRSSWNVDVLISNHSNAADASHGCWVAIAFRSNRVLVFTSRLVPLEPMSRNVRRQSSLEIKVPFLLRLISSHIEFFGDPVLQLSRLVGVRFEAVKQDPANTAFTLQSFSSQKSVFVERSSFRRYRRPFSRRRRSRISWASLIDLQDRSRSEQPTITIPVRKNWSRTIKSQQPTRMCRLLNILIINDVLLTRERETRREGDSNGTRIGLGRERDEPEQSTSWGRMNYNERPRDRLDSPPHPSTTATPRSAFTS